jgi:oxepin-CoA hydrolase/3-oxo-5,6-dehydrosuberyl-CoA semialdehyde dehydrogenase
MADQQKLAFISTGIVPLLRNLSEDAIMKWGKMNAQQMVEHLSAFFRVSTNKLHFPLVTPEDQLPSFKAFLRSEKEFRENTKAPVLPEEPFPVQFANFKDAVNDLEKEIGDFVTLFSNDTNLTTQHPVFGDLNFDDWVLLHYKHVVHHLKQFGLM